MNRVLRRTLVHLALPLLAILLLWLIGAVVFQPAPASAQQSCQVLTSTKQLVSPVLINFDNLPNAKVIADSYFASFGVTFENSKTTRAIIYGNEPANARSSPNVASNDAVAPLTSSGVPMKIAFDTPKRQVGFWLGNGSGQNPTALVTALNVAGGIVCQTRVPNVADPHNIFVGIDTGQLNISYVEIDYGQTTLSESIDDLYFAPGPGYAPPPTRTPQPTWTPIPTNTPIPGPTATATPLVPMLAYQSLPSINIGAFLTPPDFAIHGIEITQGIQCFDTSKGLAGCANNSVPVVNKKDSTARIYLKASNVSSVRDSIPVRLFIRANNVWYTANTTGKTTTAIDQATHDSADIYFNVNFNNAVAVDFYAIVDPDNTITESNESNNRFPAGTGYITLTFQPRTTMTIVGQRLRYHPSGYSGTQYASGWAVNGGAADWFEQMLPIRNNGINYSVKSGYLDWTTSLGSGDGQHALIQSLNAQWMLENIFSWMFSGPYTGARHVYGWAPSAGYSGGHADMPVYPHAGGIGVVGIGSDATGTSTDAPGSGALIFGHELTHDYDVMHTNTSDACGSNDSNSDFPYSSSSIQEFGYNPFTGKIYNPSNTHDLMSYCPSGGSREGWISPFTWNKMFTKLAQPAAPELMAPEAAPAYTLYLTGSEESLQINATVFNPAGAPQVPGQLGNLYKTKGGLGYNLAAGPYAVELRNVDGKALASYPFAVNFESEYDGHSGPDHPESDPLANDPPPFPSADTGEVDVSFIVPWDPATQSVALVLNGQDLDVVNVSPNAPQVLFTAPSAAENWAAGSAHTLTWQGLDLDGDPLSYSIFYSSDAGVTWELIANNLTGTSLDVNANDLAGGSDVRFRVVVTDGLNTAFDETDQTITVPNKAPFATVLNPLDGGFFKVGALVVFQGMGVDLEDGTLPDGSLTWVSNRDGTLGIGPSLPINSLTRGKHTITLTAIDSSGASTVLTFKIMVGKQFFLAVMMR